MHCMRWRLTYLNDDPSRWGRGVGQHEEDGPSLPNDLGWLVDEKWKSVPLENSWKGW